ncbi:MAG: hypothetical protein QUS08_07715 [Methanothrix sp.]|nr:hypothetical protein [Methanothrix sp.]
MSSRMGGGIRFIAACTVLLTLSGPSYAGEDLSSLESLITSYEDVQIDSYDLAFLLATHNFDAVPKDGYVLLRLGGAVYRLTPNGDAPGLCAIEATS